MFMPLYNRSTRSQMALYIPLRKTNTEPKIWTKKSDSTIIVKTRGFFHKNLKKKKLNHEVLM